jgi:GNAT superfamily N-acetyltransferase
MADIPIQIRRAEVKDLPILAKFGLALAQLHAIFDERHFVVPEDGEVSFLRFFEAELAREDAVLLVAEIAATPVGYALVRIEPASLEDLRGMGAWLHDIYVAPDVRARGIGRQLVEAAFDAARSLGSTSLMLGVSPRNASGRALFDRMGFRATMVEMRAELRE